jgi:acyl-CoA synthetase (NDP forming)
MITKFPDKHILVEPMHSGNVEIIIGLLHDPTFGLTIMAGIGGIFTELYKDVSFRIVPISRYDADSMLKELHGAKLLEGFRGVKVNRNAVIDLLLKMSAFGIDFEKYIEQMDLNPVIVNQNNAVVVDAKLILKKA